MRVLISAYACEPGEGSEPEVGLQTVLAAAREHEVWVITRENNVPALRAALADRPRVDVVGLEVGGPALKMKKAGGLVTLHLYYEMWQRRLAELAVSLDNQYDFDLVHHVTFAAYWSRAGVAAVPKPLVWGPVGGGVSAPARLLSTMGAGGALGDLVRVAARPLVARLSGAVSTAERAAAILTQNPETARRIRQPAKTRVLPNGLVGGLSVGSQTQTTTSTFVAAGRLIGWKGMGLGILAMRHMSDGDRLEIFGDGPDRRRLERLARRCGVEDRVRFRGRVPRDEVLAAMAGARAFLHPALHEESGLTVAEALALGTPVVCLDRGGPPVLLSHWPEVPSRAVTPSTPAITARRLATALKEVDDYRADFDVSPAESFAEELLVTYETVGKDGRS